MTRQEAVVKMLIDGFGEENVEQYTSAEDAGLTPPQIALVVFRRGTFIIDKSGNIAYPEDINPELAYWIAVDLASLDILREESV